MTGSPNFGDGKGVAVISCTVEIFEQDGGHWLLITGSLFGPFHGEDEAIDAIPSALRTLE